MSKKNRKLGRGLSDLLEQKRIHEEEEKRLLEERSGSKDTLPSANLSEPLETSLVDENEEYEGDDMPFQYSKSGIFSEIAEFPSELDEESLAETQNESTLLSKSGATVLDFPHQESAGPKTLMDFVSEEEREALPEKLPAEASTFTAGNTASRQEDLAAVDRIYNISVSLIDSNPWQPREIFQAKEISELAESIKIHGLLQPIVVREVKNRYQLIAGERRFRAAMKLNWTQVPVTIVDATDREMAELALIENIQRKDLNPIEKAASFQKYLDENHCTQEELARRLQIDRSTISNLVRLLTLPKVIQQMVTDEQLTQGHARSLLSLTTTQDQTAMAHRIADEKLSVRQTEQIVSDWKAKPIMERRQESITKVPTTSSGKEKKEKSANILDLERQLQDSLDLKVRITVNPAGKGKLEIFFSNNEDFSALMAYFR